MGKKAHRLASLLGDARGLVLVRGLDVLLTAAGDVGGDKSIRWRRTAQGTATRSCRAGRRFEQLSCSRAHLYETWGESTSNESQCRGRWDMFPCCGER